MRINFDGRYRELSPLVETPEKGTKSAHKAEFQTLLSEISPNRSNILKEEKIFDKTKPTFSALQLGEPGPMASLNLPKPGPELPQNKVETATRETGGVVNESRKGVKSPAPLEVRKIAPEHFDRMSHSKRVDVTEDLVKAAGVRHGVDPDLGMAVISAESGFKSTAISSDGHSSKGLFQLLDSTGKHLHERAGLSRDYDPFSPEQNVDLGVGYLRKLHDLFSQATELPNKLKTQPAANSSALEKLAVAAFNAGEGRVASAQESATKNGNNPGIFEEISRYLPDSTREYVTRVMRMKSEFESRK